MTAASFPYQFGTPYKDLVRLSGALQANFRAAASIGYVDGVAADIISGSVILSDDPPQANNPVDDPGISEEASRADHIHPTDATRAPAGLLILNTRTVTDDDAITADDAVIRADATGVAVDLVIDLPAVVTVTGQVFAAKKVDAGIKPVKLAADGAELIDGASDQTLALQGDVIWVQSNGTSWDIL